MERLLAASQRVVEVRQAFAAETYPVLKSRLAVHLWRFEQLRQMHVRRQLGEGREPALVSDAAIASALALAELMGRPIASGPRPGRSRDSPQRSAPATISPGRDPPVPQKLGRYSLSRGLAEIFRAKRQGRSRSLRFCSPVCRNSDTGRELGCSVRPRWVWRARLILVLTWRDFLLLLVRRVNRNFPHTSYWCP